MGEIKIYNSWKSKLEEEFNKDYMVELRSFLEREYRNGKTIYPSTQNYFRSLNLCPIESVKVVIVGQDPYHGPGQAHGLSFSVPTNVPFPPSLQNIFKELKTDLNIPPPTSGDLTPWAEQGVLLLNSVLTVEQAKAASHQGKGWEKFTDRIIEILNSDCSNIAFILWGKYAQKKGAIVDRNKHFVLESPHPSPLSAYQGFFGTKPFSKINSYLESVKKKPIEWRLEVHKNSEVGECSSKVQPRGPQGL